MLRSRILRRTTGENREGDAAPVGCAPRDAGLFTAGRWTELDVFFLANAALFVLMCVFAYHDRWVDYMGTGRTAEFLFYAGLVTTIIEVLRRTLPRRPVPPALLVLIEVYVLAGFAGGFVHLDGERLYDQHLLGLRYDKYVHALGAFVIGLAILEMMRMRGLPRGPFLRTTAFFAALGTLAVWELVEYVVRATVPGNGIGGYDDTMSDLFANLAGGLVFIAVGGRLHRAFRRSDSSQEVPIQTPLGGGP